LMQLQYANVASYSQDCQNSSGLQRVHATATSGQASVRHPAGITISPRPLASKLKIDRRTLTLQQHVLI